MLLSYTDIVELLNAGIVTRTDYSLINAASLDIRLGKRILVEARVPPIIGSGQPVVPYDQNFLHRVSLKDKDSLLVREYDLEKDGPFIMAPGEFILAHSIEIFHLPNWLSAEYKLKSSMARLGLEHLKAGWCDAGWHGSVLTLELKNMTRNHEIVLHAGDKIGQITFWKHTEVPKEHSYATKGRYNNDRSVSGVKTSSTAIAFGNVEDDAYQEEFNRMHPASVTEPELPKNAIAVDEGE